MLCSSEAKMTLTKFMAFKVIKKNLGLVSPSPSKFMAFKIIKKNLGLVSPSEHTPYDFKSLSDVDDQDGLRCQISMVQIYKNNPSMEGKDPIPVLRNAVAKALVFYYPIAGRLREHADRKLVVECTGEGVVFVEARADVTLQQFGDELYPPFSHVEELLPELPSSDKIINCPLLNIQVTRLKCGGFILAYRFNHTMFDGTGIRQFLTAVAELAGGATVPATLPVWERHLLTARRPPRVSFTHPEYDFIREEPSIPLDKMVERSFFFSAATISALRRSLPPHLQSCSNFEVLAACVWRCRTIALSHKPDEYMRFLCAMDMRKRMNPPMPEGYYGNATIFPAAVTTAGELAKKPLAYAVELVREAKRKGTDEYMRSVVDFMVLRNRRPSFTAARTYGVSNLTRAGFEQVDFGWGRAAYGGVLNGFARIPAAVSWYRGFKDEMGEEGVVVPESLPVDAMEEFEKQLQMMISSELSVSKL